MSAALAEPDRTAVSADWCANCGQPRSQSPYHRRPDRDECGLPIGLPRSPHWLAVAGEIALIDAICPPGERAPERWSPVYLDALEAAARGILADVERRRQQLRDEAQP